MKTINRLKEEIGLNKLLMAISSAIASSLVSWLFNNNVELLSLRFIAACLAMLLFLSLGLFFFVEIINKIKELDNE